VNSLQDGAWALQFGIGSNFTLNAFNGATISVKKHLSDRSAVRVGITVSALSSDSDVLIASSQDTLLRAAESGRDTYGASLGLEWVRYFRPEARWSFFAGLGPSVSFAHNAFTDKSVNETIVRDDKTKLWGFGVNGLFGGEWFATRVIGIHAEYRIGAGYSETSEDGITRGPGVDSEVHREDKSWSLSPGFVRFGLSAYF
jgi:hypothetical protein